uniref:Uncharacterized protein n=1 Tax=Anguilla anguilla TaxID=7936 RepID=A0A0E9QVG8_ANGAN
MRAKMSSTALRLKKLKWWSNLADRIDAVTSADSYTPTHLHTYTPTHLHTYTPTHLHTYTPRA